MIKVNDNNSNDDNDDDYNQYDIISIFLFCVVLIDVRNDRYLTESRTEKKINSISKDRYPIQKCSILLFDKLNRPILYK